MITSQTASLHYWNKVKIDSLAVVRIYFFIVDICLTQVRSDWYVFAVLSSLPWVGRELYEKKEGEFQKLLVTIDNYIR